MAKAKTKPTTTDLNKMRRSLIELSVMQIELRQHLVDYRRLSGESIGTVSRKTNIKWTTLKSFEDGETCIGRGEGLKALCRLLDCEALGEKIMALADEVPDRYRAFVVLSTEAMAMGMDLIEMYQLCSDNYTQAEFAESFAEWSTIVAGVLDRSKSALVSLEEESSRMQITMLLENDFEKRLEAAKASQRMIKQEAARRLIDILPTLEQQLGGRSAVSRALGCSRTSLQDVVNGVSSMSFIETLTRKAEKLSRKMVAVRVEPELLDTAALGTESTDEGSSYSPDATELNLPATLMALGGTTTSDGVRFVLTEASFRGIDHVAVTALRDHLRTVLETARLLLNIASQMTDKVARDILKESIGREVEELGVAMRTYSYAHPFDLMELYDSQRDVLAAKRSNRPSNSGKATK